MKKFKNYILMLLVPLILLGCVSKGVSEAVEEDTSNPYGFDKMTIWVQGDEYDTSYSVNKNIVEISTIQGLYGSSTSAYKDMANLLTYLKKFKNEVLNQSSSFVYSTSYDNINTYNATSIESTEVLTTSQLKELESKLSSTIAAAGTAPTWLTTLKTDVTNTITDINNRKTNNYVYADFPDLYWIYKSSTGLEYYNDSLLALNIDIKNLNANEAVSTAISVINQEITDLASLSDKLTTFKQESTLNTKLVFLKSVFTGYINGTKTLTNIYDTLDELNDYENDLLAISSDEPYLFKKSVDDVYTAIKNYSSTNSDLMTYRNEIKLKLDEYDDLNTQYDKQNYTKINSKIVNVMKTYYYLYQQKSTLKNKLGITL